MKRNASAVLWIAVLLGVGCAHSVQYKLTDKDRWPGPARGQSVAVATFTDTTAPGPEREFKDGTYTWRLNYRDGYKGKEIANGISSMIAEHLRYSGLFQKVIQGPGGKGTDYELSGAIAEYYSRGRINKGAEATMAAGAGFGAIGAAMTIGAIAGMKTEVSAGVELRDVTLRDLRAGVVMWTNTTRGRLPTLRQGAGSQHSTSSLGCMT